MKKILVVSKDGYQILADVNAASKRLCNFSVKGVNANPNVSYTMITEAEALINHLTKKQEKYARS